MRKFVFAFFLLVAGSLLWTLCGCSSPNAQTPPVEVPRATTAPATRPAVLATFPSTFPALPPETGEAARIHAQKLLNDGLADSVAGHFDKGFIELRQAQQLDPSNPTVQKAVKLLWDYEASAVKFRAEREQEYQEAVTRVERAMIAEKYLPTLAKEHLEKELRTKVVDDIMTTYSKALTSDVLETASKEEADKYKANSLEALKAARAGMPKVLELLRKDHSEYSDTFRSLCETAMTQLDLSIQAWQNLKTDTLQDRLSGCRKIQAIEDDTANAMGDVEAMIMEKPWRVALGQGRLARQLYTGNKEDLPKEKWFSDLVTEARARGKAFIEKAEWADALAVYGSLKDLLPDDPEIRETAKECRLHMTMLGLYGPHSQGGAAAKKTKNSKTQPADEDRPDENEPTWKELVSGIDAEMVRSVISQLDEYYVTTVDYHKLIQSALGALEVLAETPQAASSFPALKDDAKRKAFLDEISRLMKHFQAKDRVDHLDLQLALNNAVTASERTVDIPTEVISMTFAEGFLSELDEFSNVIWPYDLPDFQKQTMGHFFGVGVQIAKEPGESLKVVTPLPGSPAYKAGIKTGDTIVAVDGRPTEDLPVDKLVRMITGEKGTKVVLTIKRGAAQFDMPLIRDEITIRTVKGWERDSVGGWEYLVDGGQKVGYIRISQFTDETHDDLVEALKALHKAGMKSLIIDLRFNPGGLLRSAADVADEFLNTGRIVSTRGRQMRQNELNAGDGGEYVDGDLIVLVNEQSASAAEILSGALKDWHRAVIVGERSYGKGSVQNIIPIRQKRALLKLTTAYYYLPSGRLLHRKPGAKEWGVDPDVESYITPMQTKRWLDIRRQTDLLQDIDAKYLRDDLNRQYAADAQLETAVLLLKLMRIQEDLAAAKSTVPATVPSTTSAPAK